MAWAWGPTLYSVIVAAAASGAQVRPSGGLSGDLRLGLQLIGGESRSPFLTGPEGAPLLNTELTAQAQSTYNLVVTPNGELRWRARAQEHALSYGPRLFLNLKRPDTAPTVYHILSARSLWGRPTGVVVALTPTVTIGGLDLGGTGTGSTATPGALYSGSTRPGSINGIPSNYLSLNLSGRVELPVVRGLRLSSTELFSAARSPVRPSLPQTPQELPTAGGSLLNMTRLDSLNELLYRAPAGGAWRGQLALGWANFPATRSYLSLLPGVAWERGLSRGGRLFGRLGALIYRSGKLPGHFEDTDAIAVVEAGISHSLASLGLPRLRGGAALALGPYYDLVFGLVEPRTTVTLDAAYDWTRLLSTSVQARYYTERYPGHLVPPRHDRDVVIVTATARGKFTPWMSGQLGGYTITRRRNPSRTDTTDGSNDYFFFVGLDGTLSL